YLSRCPIAEEFDQPPAVVAGDERADGPPRLLQGLELMKVEALLFQRADEPLDDTVALGSARILSSRVPASRKTRFQLSSSWVGTGSPVRRRRELRHQNHFFTGNIFISS